MGTDIRPEISKKNRYWIEKHRYYELKHFCLQYPIWKNAYASLDGISKRSNTLVSVKNTSVGDPTAKCAEAKMYYSERIKMVERAAEKADSDLACYILKAVTEGLSFEYLDTKLGIPCSRDTYYDRYRKFFRELSYLRD